MYKIIFIMLINFLFIGIYYYTDNIVWLIVNQVLISLFATLTDNAVSVNIKNIHNLHTNFEGLLQVITKVTNRAKSNLGMEWEDME